MIGTRGSKQSMNSLGTLSSVMRTYRPGRYLAGGVRRRHEQQAAAAGPHAMSTGAIRARAGAAAPFKQSARLWRIVGKLGAVGLQLPVDRALGIVVERLALVLDVVFARGLTAERLQLERNESQPLALEASDDLAGQVAGKGVRLDKNERTLHGGRSFL